MPVVDTSKTIRLMVVKVLQEDFLLNRSAGYKFVTMETNYDVITRHLL